MNVMRRNLDFLNRAYDWKAMVVDKGNWPCGGMALMTVNQKERKKKFKNVLCEKKTPKRLTIKQLLFRRNCTHSEDDYLYKYDFSIRIYHFCRSSLEIA